MVRSGRSSVLFIIFLLSQTRADDSSGNNPKLGSGFSWETQWWIPVLCIVLALALVVVVAFLVYVCVCRKNNQESAECPENTPTFTNQSSDPVESGAVTPRQQTPAGPPSIKVPKRTKDHMIQPGKIEKGRFTFLGPLKVDSGVKGPVRHGLEGEKSHSLKGIVLDESQNMVRYIGSNVECRETSPVGTVTMEDNDNTLEALKSKENVGITRSTDTLHQLKSKEMVGPMRSLDGQKSRELLVQSGDLKVGKTQERTVKWSVSKSHDKGVQKNRQRKSWEK